MQTIFSGQRIMNKTCKIAIVGGGIHDGPRFSCFISYLLFISCQYFEYEYKYKKRNYFFFVLNENKLVAPVSWLEIRNNSNFHCIFTLILPW